MGGGRVVGGEVVDPAQDRAGGRGLLVEADLDGDLGGVGIKLDADAGRGARHLAEEAGVPRLAGAEGAHLLLGEAPGADPAVGLADQADRAVQQRRCVRAHERGGRPEGPYGVKLPH